MRSRGLLILLQANRVWAAILVTVISLLLIGSVMLVTTSVGCDAGSRLGLKMSRCTATSTSQHLTTPTPTFHPPTATSQPVAPPATNPASSYPPNTNPASGYPPNANPGSASPPQDPFFGPASGVSGPPGLNLNCRLPVYAGGSGSGGFVLFPGANFIADPRSAVSPPSPSPAATSAPPQGAGPGPGYGSFGLSYDAKHSRWLPVPTNWVAPDGNHYAFPSGSAIVVVDPASGTQVQLGQGRSWGLLKVLDDRVYAGAGDSPGFWVLPFSGAPRQVTTVGWWRAATATAAFGTPTSAVPQGATEQVIKLDIASGAATDWFSRPNASINIVGFDFKGNPLINTQYPDSNGWALWLTTSPTNATVIANSWEYVFIQGAPIADSYGIWFPVYVQGQNLTGIALYVAGSGLYWMASVGGQLAGACA